MTINRQLQEGRNYKRLYFELKTKFDALKAEHLALQEQVKTVTEAQSARIEQLEAMVFGRKNRLPRQPKLRLTLKQERSTYHRPFLRQPPLRLLNPLLLTTAAAAAIALPTRLKSFATKKISS